MNIDKEKLIFVIEKKVAYFNSGLKIDTFTQSECRLISAVYNDLLKSIKNGDFDAKAD